MVGGGLLNTEDPTGVLLRNLKKPQLRVSKVDVVSTPGVGPWLNIKRLSWRA